MSIELIFYRDKMTNVRQGLFEVIDSFAVRQRNEFYLIGVIKEGHVQKGSNISVPLNSLLSLTVEITGIEDIEMSSEPKIYKLIIVHCGDDDALDLPLGLKIGGEIIEITADRENNHLTKTRLQLNRPI